MNQFITTIISTDPTVRNRPFHALCSNMSTSDLLKSFHELDVFRKSTPNLYERVRACIFLYAGYRFFLQKSKDFCQTGKIPVEGYDGILKRNFEKSIEVFTNELLLNGPNSNIFSCLAESYHHLTFQILADQVRKSVRSSKGNQWMFRVGHYEDHPLRIHPLMLKRDSKNDLFPLLQEKTPVRMDLTHSAWSDIFFLGMDYPEGARVINVSIDLGVYGRDKEVKAPLESYFRVIPEPVIRLTSLDLKTTKDITELSDLFNFGNDYLSLIKAAIIASGFIPPSFEGSNNQIKDILGKIVSPGYGIELVTKVNDIPKGSRLAVSTNLLGSMISLLMRVTGQTQSLEGLLTEQERRLIASRAILGEWLGGSGGGWQDSGGVWNGVKAIEGTLAKEGDLEYGISRGCLLPRHYVLDNTRLHDRFEERLSSSLVLMHGGMASNVGPILEMVTEKYLLRSVKEWAGRQETNSIYEEMLEILKNGDIKRLASLTTRNFNGPIKSIIPAATNHFTETIIARAREVLGDNYWGFLMLGGMSGGGMGMFVNPEIYSVAKEKILQILRETKDSMDEYLPFAMKPVVYDFRINHNGSASKLFTKNEAVLADSYYSLHIPLLVNRNPDKLSEIRKKEIDIATATVNGSDASFQMLRSMVCKFFTFTTESGANVNANNEETEKIKKENGFDYIQHEQIRQDLIKGRIGIARNRLPAETIIEDVNSSDITVLSELSNTEQSGSDLLASGKVAIMCLAAGVGSRWTKGAGVIKALNPCIEINGRHRSFLEIHLAKARNTAHLFNCSIPFTIATSYLTHKPIERILLSNNNFGYSGNVYLSPGRSIGQRFIPMERDLRFLWEEMAQEQLDENKQKVRDALRGALIDWAKNNGEGSDYTENLPQQRLSPLGHWYEFPNMLRNGVLANMLRENPGLEHIMLHNIDTLGTDISPAVLNYHVNSGNALTFEVIARHVDDRGGGLARINGKVRLLEGLAQPHDDDELGLSYYNTLTTWINIEKLLTLFGMVKNDLYTMTDSDIAEAVRRIARRMPSYVTVKDVKYRWGHGQEDIYPVAQIEKLWGDMSALPDLKCGYVAVPRLRGQQLKAPSQLDAWIIDGSRDYVASLCRF